MNGGKRWLGTLTKTADGVEEGTGEALDAKVNGSEESVFHEDDVTAVGVRNDDAPFGIEEGEIAFDHKRLPAGVGEESADLLIGGWRAGDGRLADQQAEASVGLECSEEGDLIAENLIMKIPALQVRDGRGFGFFLGPVDDKQAEEVVPGGFEVGPRVLFKPDLMFIALLVRNPIQFVRLGRDDETGFVGVVAEDSEFLGVIG